jgi:hypothetical protein
MSFSRPVTVVDITSPSYAGTTWLCLLLGSHERVFALGPPDRVWSQRHAGCPDACRVHGPQCPFWPDFLADYDPGANFYLQLAERAGRDVIVINNPTAAHAAAELEHPDLVIRRMQLVRDGRALACSFARHRRVDFLEAARDFVRPVYHRIPALADRDDVLALRYEDLMADQPGHLRRFGAFLGLSYAPDAVRFWEYEHHVTSGNAGAIALLKLFQGEKVPDFRQRAFYQAQFERMRRGEGGFEDERWKRELGRRELFVFDHFCGRANARWGYEEDAFTSSERDRFLADLGAELRPFRTAAAERLRGGRAWVRARLGGWPVRPGRSLRRRLAVAALLWAASIVLAVILTHLVTSGR